MIPKVIHYCWFGNGELPELAQKCIHSWKKYCPDYEIVRWDESNVDLEVCEYAKEAYEQKEWAFVSDYIRLLVLYKYGGIYLDTDVEIIQSLDSLLENKGFMGFEGKKYISSGLGCGFEKGNILVKKMLEDYTNAHFRKKDGSLDKIPCPHRNTDRLVNCGLKRNGKLQKIEGVVFLPNEYLNPFDNDTGLLNKSEKTYSIHWYSGSWMDSNGQDENNLYWQYTRKYGKKIGKIIYLVKTLGLYKILRIILDKYEKRN